ncbi:MAG TPA: DUF885 domain-containing protein, partial [Lacunisphaera sp.]|nr:DUF885 domain-containing protein [Lacunisphaera sp.]
MQSKLRFFAALALAGASVLSGRSDELDARYQAVAAAKGRASETERLHALFKTDWDYTMAVYPEYATWVGYPGDETRWTDWSREAIARRRALAGRALPVLATIDRAQLGAADRVSHDIFKRMIEEEVEGTAFPREFDQITQLSGIHQEAAQLFRGMRADNAAQLETQLARLKALPAVVDHVISLLEEGLARGITPPQITLREVPAQVLNQIPEEPLKSPLLGSFVDLPPAVSGEAGMGLRAAAAKTYTADVRPAFQRLEKFLREKYLPAARTTIAATDLPDGRAWYAWRIKTQTSTDLTAQQIHDIGLAEVKRIRAEMERVKAETGFKGSLAEFFTHLRTDPKFYFTDKEEL